MVSRTSGGGADSAGLAARPETSNVALEVDWAVGGPMIRKLASGKFRLYSKKKDPKTGKRRNLGTFKTRAAAEKHERAVQYFKRH